MVGVFARAVAPDRQDDGNHQQDRSENAPGQSAGRCFGDRFGDVDFGNGFGLRKSFARGLEVVGDGLLFVEPHAAGVGANESLVKNAAGQLVELLLFQRLEHAGADFGRRRDLLERDGALLAFFFQLFAEGRQGMSAGTGDCTLSGKQC